ncbi:hypothetical protein [Nostoc sp.]|uniref:hypothetical protein n=1 Tax=Nostoc sp. TaxID=1180 RepID=UPI002FFA7098
MRDFWLLNASCYPAGTLRANKSAEPTTVASSRETLSAIAHGGNPQDRVASPRRCLPNALAPFDFCLAVIAVGFDFAQPTE